MKDTKRDAGLCLSAGKRCTKGNSECKAGLVTTNHTLTQRETCGTSQTPSKADPGKGCSRVSAVCAAGCPGCPGETNTAGGIFVVDIEDITALMPQCLFNRPSQYYLKVVNGEKLS